MSSRRGTMTTSGPASSLCVLLLVVTAQQPAIAATIEAQKAGLVDCCVGFDAAAQKRVCRLVAEKQNWCSFAKNAAECHNAKTSSRPCVWDAGKCVKGYLYGTVGLRPVCPDPPLYRDKSSATTKAAKEVASAAELAGSTPTTAKERETRIKERQEARDVQPKNQPSQTKLPQTKLPQMKPQTKPPQTRQPQATTSQQPAATSQRAASQDGQVAREPLAEAPSMQEPGLEPQARLPSSWPRPQQAEPRDAAPPRHGVSPSSSSSSSRLPPSPSPAGLADTDAPADTRLGAAPSVAKRDPARRAGGTDGSSARRPPPDDARRPLTPSDVVHRLTPMLPTLINATSSALQTLRPVVDNATTTFLRDQLPSLKEHAKSHAHRFRDKMATEVLPVVTHLTNSTAHKFKGLVVRNVLSQGLPASVSERLGLPEAKYVGDLPAAAWARVEAQPAGTRLGIYLWATVGIGGMLYLLVRCACRLVRRCCAASCCCCQRFCGMWSCRCLPQCCGWCASGDSHQRTGTGRYYRRVRDRREREALKDQDSGLSLSDTDDDEEYARPRRTSARRTIRL
jgi:hypothetical protein